MSWPAVGVALVLAAAAAAAGLVVLLSAARRQRSTHGKYNPQKQEASGQRLELELKIKPPPEERLI